MTHPRTPPVPHRSVLLDLFVVGDDLADPVHETALVVGDKAHEDPLFGRIQQHQDSDLTGRRGVREVDTAGLKRVRSAF